MGSSGNCKLFIKVDRKKRNITWHGCTGNSALWRLQEEFKVRMQDSTVNWTNNLRTTDTVQRQPEQNSWGRAQFVGALLLLVICFVRAMISHSLVFLLLPPEYCDYM